MPLQQLMRYRMARRFFENMSLSQLRARKTNDQQRRELQQALHSRHKHMHKKPKKDHNIRKSALFSHQIYLLVDQFSRQITN